jgi:hypothetical protein
LAGLPFENFDFLKKYRHNTKHLDISNNQLTYAEEGEGGGKGGGKGEAEGEGEVEGERRGEGERDVEHKKGKVGD